MSFDFAKCVPHQSLAGVSVCPEAAALSIEVLALDGLLITSDAPVVSLGWRQDMGAELLAALL